MIQIVQQVIKTLDLTRSSSVYKIDLVQNSSPNIDIVKPNIFLTQNRQEGLVIREVPYIGVIYLGAAVIMTSEGFAKLALADSFANSNVIGLIDSINNDNTCDVRFMGVTGQIFLGLDTTLEYYLSDTIPGGLTTNPPTTIGHIRLKLGQPFSSTQFVFVKGERIIKG